MFHGQLLAILLHGPKGKDLRSVDSVSALAGRGLEGDRYCRADGSGTPAQEVTLIEAEALEALVREVSIDLPPTRARRNLLTRDVPLNHLVGEEFTVGEVVLKGIRLCEPCDHLEGLTVKGVKDGLHHRGGLRAEIVRGGTLRPGDAIRPRNA
jgi:MOSC domain-containing protein YiiM